MKTLQEQYNLILEGKGDKDLFMRSARRIFPQYINQYTTFNETTKILKSKSILTERFIGGLVTQSDKKPDWFKIFNENINEAKAIESKPTKEIVDMETRGFDYKDPKNIDNVFGPQFLTGYYAEMKDPKNSEKTVEELKTIVAKNLAKDIMYYTKDGQFGVKGLGYKESTPTKEVKGKYKAAGVEVAPKIIKESKLREYISKIIKEELNEGSIVINGKTVRTYTQNGDTSYNVTYDDGTKDRIAVNNDGWDEIYALHKNATNSELTEEPKYEDTMPKYRLGALKKLLDISIKDGSPQDVITHLQNAIQSLEKQA
jgi:hypothetical protein